MVAAHGQPGEHGIAFGPFVLERRIAVGGTAEVFLAHPKVGAAPAPRLVVKKLLPSASEGFRYDVLEHEAELHRHVRHRNVVTVFGAGMVRDEPYLAMEYVEGVDLYRLLGRLDAERRPLPAEVAVLIARRVAEALSAVHAARDGGGRLLGIVHRDVTPSNVYLSVQGEIKLGDFGIARIENEGGSTQPGAGLKGKFAYLSPEQVAGEPFDHRADLFALAALFGEMLIGERVFPGKGQLAVLLAIRDGNLEPLERAAARLPPKMVEVCRRGLSVDPAQRFQTAGDFARALDAFESRPHPLVAQELAELVTWALDQRELSRHIEVRVRDSVKQMRAVKALVASPARAEQSPARVRKLSGGVLDALPFAELVELITRGQLNPNDEVSLPGEPFRRIRDVPELARHFLPVTTAVTGRFSEPGLPDYRALLAETPMLSVLAHVRQRRQSGVLFVQRSDDPSDVRKEIYFERGKLHHVVSSDRNELLGEYLIRRGRLARSDLDRALGALRSTGGKLGDLLIDMGLVGAVDLFRAIRDQGRDRVAALCGWREGEASFYEGAHATHVDFPLDLDVAHCLMAGIVVAHQGEPRRALPSGLTLVVPGPRTGALDEAAELESAPSALRLLAPLVTRELTIETLLLQLTIERAGSDGRTIGAREASAALASARWLGWVEFDG